MTALKRALRGGSSAHAREPEVLQRVLDDLSLHRVQRAALALGDLKIGAVQRLALRDIGLEFRQQRQAFVVGAAQRLTVHDGIEVAHRGPHLAEPMAQLLQRLDQRRECRRGLRLELGHACALLGEQAREGGHDVLGPDGIEGRQGRIRQQWIGARRRRCGQRRCAGGCHGRSRRAVRVARIACVAGDRCTMKVGGTVAQDSPQNGA